MMVHLLQLVRLVWVVNGQSKLEDGEVGRLNIQKTAIYHSLAIICMYNNDRLIYTLVP